MTAPSGSTAEVEVKDVPDRSQFELLVGGEQAGKLVYRLDGDVFVAVHTEVDDAYSGQGLAEKLVRYALDQLRDTGLTLRAECPYVRRFLRKHSEYADLTRPKGE